PALVVVLALRAQLRYVVVAAGDALRQRLCFLLEQRELVTVVEAEQPATTVVDRAAIVLLEAVAGMLDLTFAGNATLDVAQLARVHAFVVETLAQFTAQPGFEAAVAQFQLVQQRACG